MQQEVETDFDLWRQLLGAEPAMVLLDTRKWAVDLHEAFVVFLGNVEPHIPGFKEIEVHYENQGPAIQVHIKIGMQDESVEPFESLDPVLLANNKFILSRINALMQQQPEVEFIDHMNAQLATAMEVFGNTDTDRWFGVFHSKTTQLKAEAMLKKSYPYWCSLDEKSKMEQTTSPAPNQASGPSRRM